MIICNFVYFLVKAKTRLISKKYIITIKKFNQSINQNEFI